MYLIHSRILIPTGETFMDEGKEKSVHRCHLLRVGAVDADSDAEAMDKARAVWPFAPVLQYVKGRVQ
jgi:hypothetical protein